MVWILLLAFFVSAVVTRGVLASSHRHDRWSADHDLSGPQKMHVTAVPRVGGIGIAAGLLMGWVGLALHRPDDWKTAALLCACALPAAGSGFIEDFTKSVSPRRRMLAVALSGALGAWLLDAVLVRTGWSWFDSTFVAVPAVAVLLTIFTVSGVVNSFNIIDGMNGLASMSATLILVVMCYVALQVGDSLVASLALATIGAALGFFVWNFPRGLIFLGDGGAYILGLMVVELGFMLLYRNPSVSPMLPLVLVIYPVVETVFTMYRRRILRGRPVSLPDGIHLHTLIYRRLMRWASGSMDQGALTRSNSYTSPYLWSLACVSLLPAVIWWNSTPMLLLTMVLFVLVYLRLYWRIVRFQTPSWMVRMAGRRAARLSAG